MDWPHAMVSARHLRSGIVQVVGYGDLLFASEHLVIPAWWWEDVRTAPWLEVVDLDDNYIWRAPNDVVLRENARVKHIAEDFWMLYLPCFYRTDLDRKGYLSATGQAK